MDGETDKPAVNRRNRDIRCDVKINSLTTVSPSIFGVRLIADPV